MLDVEKVAVALARGAACNIDLSDHWDFWPYMPRPLDDVRRELGIPPLEAPPGTPLALAPRSRAAQRTEESSYNPPPK